MSRLDVFPECHGPSTLLRVSSLPRVWRRLAWLVLPALVPIAGSAASWQLGGALGAHDPSIIREGHTWWCFATGAGLPVKFSSDGLNWQQGAPLFAAELQWWRTYAPNMGALDVWAPDVHVFGGRTWCFYCVSEFGHNNSAIGLESCTSIAAGDWRDDGLVISSKSGVDAFNAIDPSLTMDAAGNPWLVFGSWFDGIHLVQLDPGTMKPAGTVYSLAQRANGIEGANIVSANGFFCLFVSIDMCCQGVNSTYKIAYGRAQNITGPYIDQGNVAMLGGGATVLTAGDSRWKGPGGQSVVANGSAWVIAYHAYDANNNGTPTLLINDLFWDSNNWPTLVGPGVTVSTLAGQAGSPGGTDGTGSGARFSSPADLAADGAGNLYVADTFNNSIRKITSAGVVTTVATGFSHPAGIALDGSGNLYVADTDNNQVRKISAAGAVTTVAAGFSGPSGIAADTAANLYVADTLSHTIRKVTPAGVVSVVAGVAGVSGSADGIGSAARFHGPQGLALDGAGNLYVADTNNSAIRKIALASGTVTTSAGLAGVNGGTDGAGSQARFFFPSGVALDASGKLYIADTDNSTVRAMSASGVVTTLAGQMGTNGSADGVDGAARFYFPAGIAADSAGNLYVADTNNSAIREVLPPVAPSITTQPQSQTVTVGASVQFSVTATGRPAPNYQWNFNGTAISGATASSFSLASAQLSNAGDYTVMVSNNSGSVTSARATLTVNSAGTGSSGGGGGGGGGGATENWLVAAMALLAAARRATIRCRGRKRSKAPA